MNPTATERKALQCLRDHDKEGVRASQVGMAVTGGIKANGTRLRAQGAGFIGAKILASLRKKGWVENRLSADGRTYNAFITVTGRFLLITSYDAADQTICFAKCPECNATCKADHRPQTHGLPHDSTRHAHFVDATEGHAWNTGKPAKILKFGGR